MAFHADKLRKPVLKLRKLARPSPKLSDPERVHKLRTTTRRVEAILGSVDLPGTRGQKRLLRGLKQIRRAAGKVRDMDVLTLKAADVAINDERNCQVQLLQHLGAARHRRQRKLSSLLKRESGAVGSRLKDIALEIAPLLSSRSSRSQGAIAQVTARALELSRQLQNFPDLNRQNLHEYRKQGKELRYVLQISRPEDDPLLKALGEMKDAVGEWHDWEELVDIANGALKHGDNCVLLRELQLHADESYDHALQIANQIRKRHFTLRGEQSVLRMVARAA